MDDTLTDRLLAAEKAQRKRRSRTANARRRRKLKAARGLISKSKRRNVYERDGYRCVRCGATDDLSLDHIVPVSRGGKNDYENLQTMCRPCNVRKGNRLPGTERVGEVTPDRRRLGLA